MKISRFTLVAMMVLWLTPHLLKAQCLEFSRSTIPVSQVSYITPPSVSSYRQVAGTMDITFLQSVPLPTIPGRQLFCNLLELIPGVFARVYVPTASERSGDFKDLLTGRQLGVDPLGRPIMEGTIYDPDTKRMVNDQTVMDPFPNNVIPVNRMGPGGIYIWLIASLESTAAGSPVVFPQVAIGGSDAGGGTYSTIFTLLNTGSDTLNGNLILFLPDGMPMTANLNSGQTSTIGSSIPVSINSGQTVFITATAANPGDTNLYVGWGQVQGPFGGTLKSIIGGTLSGVATFRVSLNGALQSISGVLSSSPVTVATIPVDDDVINGRFTGFAVANPDSNSSISISVMEVSADNSTVTALSNIHLDQHQQKAAFFFQDPKANQKFKGSAVLIGQNGATFSVVALVDDQNLLTAIPVVPAKAPNVQ